jgi:flavin-binding protein dodecin
MSSIAKVIEVIAESDTSWDDAVNNALTEASKTVENIKEIWVSSMKAIVENNKVVKYRLTARITFVLKGHA